MGARVYGTTAFVAGQYQQSAAKDRTRTQPPPLYSNGTRCRVSLKNEPVDPLHSSSMPGHKLLYRRDVGAVREPPLLDSRFHGNDRRTNLRATYEGIKIRRRNPSPNFQVDFWNSLCHLLRKGISRFQVRVTNLTEVFCHGSFIRFNDHSVRKRSPQRGTVRPVLTQRISGKQ